MQKSNFIFGTKIEASPVTRPFQDVTESHDKSHIIMCWYGFTKEGSLFQSYSLRATLSKPKEIKEFYLNIKRINGSGVKLSERDTMW